MGSTIRMAPLAPEERSAEVTALLDAVRDTARDHGQGGEPPNIFLTLARHPKLFASWLEIRP